MTSRHGEAAWAVVLRDAAAELDASGIAAIGGLRGVEGQAMLVLGLSSPDRRAEAAGRAAASVRTDRRAPAGRRRGGRLRRRARRPRGRRCATRCWRRWRPRPPPSRPRRATGTTPPRPTCTACSGRCATRPSCAASPRRRLGPLIDHDAKRKSKLLPTLETYLAHGGRKAETARAMHLERQSLYHRLGRIEALLGEEPRGRGRPPRPPPRAARAPADNSDGRPSRAGPHASDARDARRAGRPEAADLATRPGTLQSLPRPGTARSAAPRCSRP